MVDSLSALEKIADTTVVKGKTLNTLIQLETIVEELLKDTNYVEISYRELVAHQAEFSWLPIVEPGDYDFIISVTDGFTTDTSTFTITVHPEIDLSVNQTEYNATVDKVFTALKITLIFNPTRYLSVNTCSDIGSTASALPKSTTTCFGSTL